jgi:hypothetical protein
MRARRILRIIVAVLLLGLAYTYWQVRQVDPEGGCTELQYLSLCLEAWLDNDATEFKRLPSDRELMERFRTYHADFDVLARRAERLQGSESMTGWRDKLGITDAEVFADDPWAFLFSVAWSKYVRGVNPKDWPLVNHLKGYIYFASPLRVDGPFLLGPPGKDGTPKYRERLLETLDGPPWPSEWRPRECVLRRIEPQWFLAICKDRVGG